jgi:hypothetical protein
MDNKFQCVYISQVAATADHLQSSYFARDDRVYKAFVENVDRRKSEIESKCSRRLRWQLTILKDFLDGRTLTFRVSFYLFFVVTSDFLIPFPLQRKIELLTEHLDDGDF